MNQDINTYPATKWITADVDGLWHLGKRKESRGMRTGKLMSVYYVTACSGRTLGGPWGQTEKLELPPNAGVCSRCQKLHQQCTSQAAAVIATGTSGTP